MKITFKEMKVGNQNLRLEIDDNEPKIAVNSKSFARLDKLVEHVPALSEPLHATPFSIAANFFFTGITFEVIEDTKKFAAKYTRMLKDESGISRYGIFDVSVIRKPYVEGNYVIFFVEEVATGLPFKVACPFPYTDPNNPFKYSLLPYASNKE